jgi:hypothetical protein
MLGVAGRDQTDPEFVKKLIQNKTVRFIPKPFAFSAMKAKRNLPPTTVGRRSRRSFETSQKKVREAIDAALKRKIGDDGFRQQGVFGKKRLH